jgi:hypothetical protein
MSIRAERPAIVQNGESSGCRTALGKQVADVNGPAQRPRSGHHLDKPKRMG